MRLRKPDFRRHRKQSLGFEFCEESLTSHAGLELLRSFICRLGLLDSLRNIEGKVRFRGDTPFRSLVLVLLGMLLVGGRRLSHVRYMEEDPVVLRFAGLDRLPSRVTLSRFLKQFSSKNLTTLDDLNIQVVKQALNPFRRRSLTIDLDGTVITTGTQVAWAARGFNPKNRKKPSYHPLQAHIAETSQVIGHVNRPGNFHDSRGAARFIRQVSNTLRGALGHRGPETWRTDAAFFNRQILETYDRLGLSYVTKVPITPWLNMKAVIASQPKKRWSRVDRGGGVEGLFVDLEIPTWDRTERIAIYRKRVFHQTRRNFQLDLFDPNDGTWEYSAVATNTRKTLRNLYFFMNGRSAQEKTIGELKSGYGYDAVPTSHYAANTAWQKLNILSHNLMVTFQMETVAMKRPRTRKNSMAHVLESIRTIRFKWLNKAARVVCRSGTRIIRLHNNKATRFQYERLLAVLPVVA